MKIKANRDYAKDRKTLKTFLEEHGKYDESGNTVFVYREQLTKLAHREQISLVIDVVDIKNYDDELGVAIQHNTKRYVNILLELVQEMLPNYKEKTVPPKDALDVYIEHLLLMEQRNQFAGEQRDPRKKYSPELMRRFEVYFKDSSVDEYAKEESNILSVRALKAEYIGQLITVKGIITKSTEVKPMLTVATYTCDQCGSETYQEINSMTFLPLQNCETEDCRVNKSGGRLYIQTKGSKFVKFQELKIQEESDQVPVGEIPRSLTVYCRGETTRQCQPGDHVYITGILLPKMKTGYASMNAAPLLTDTYFDVHQIFSKSNNENTDETNEFTAEQLEILKQEDIYTKLAQSIAPEIYGMEDVKKALLLLLVGCSEKTKGDMKIRGNINICLMGDPGVAKSQLLSFITRLCPRSQFTTGRGSSSVGLTAAVVKDPLTGQMVLEGGALVLADKGVCCIDEFDKMTESDRTAIHEVMEQQTISIAKAGIMTRLNARASILAAANPAYGRYNSNRSVEQNIALPAALLSRFDLLWLLQDVADRNNDMRLAEHITYVHRNYEKPTADHDVIDMNLMKKYIDLCKRKNPVIPESLRDTIVESYIKMRNEAREKHKNGESDRSFTSARNLLAILRLSIALARLRLADEVVEYDVEEANRLIKQSKNSINDSERKKDTQKKATQLFTLVREVAGQRTSVKVSDIVERSINQGFTVEQVMDFIDQYEDINIWQINQNKTVLTFIN